MATLKQFTLCSLPQPASNAEGSYIFGELNTPPPLADLRLLIRWLPVVEKI